MGLPIPRKKNDGDPFASARPATMTHKRHAATGLRTGGAILHALSAASAAHLHAHALKVGVLFTCLHLCLGLLKTYASSGRIAAARQLFDEAPRRNVPLWNTLVSAYARCGHPRSALAAASAMARGGGAGTRPNVVTVAILMSACAKLRRPAPGREVHGYAARNVAALDLHALNALVHMYGRCGRLRDARTAFAGIGAGARNAVSWTAMIDACRENGRPAEALGVFEEMRRLAGAEVDEAALLAAVSACASLDCAAGLGDWVEACAAESGFLRRGTTSARVANALIHMHGKAGRVERSCAIFDSMGAARRTVVSWTAMVQALATNGHAVAALVRFAQMLREGFVPDEVAFLSAIGACACAGLVSEGRRLFESMVEEHRIAPQMEHYGSMVELLCRAGSLADAFEFVLAMPVAPDPVIWRALAGACRDHGDAGLARRVMDHVIAMEPHHAGNYLLASNLCAADEDWGRVVDVRLEMGARKATISRTASGAVSSVQVDGE